MVMGMLSFQVETTMQGMVVWRARLRSASLPDAVRTFLQGVMAGITYPIGDNLFVWTMLAPVSRLEEVGLTPRSRARGPKYASGSHQPGDDKEATDKYSSHLPESKSEAEELSVKEVACSCMPALFVQRRIFACGPG